MTVRPTESESVHAGASRRFLSGPLKAARRDRKSRCFKINIRAGSRKTRLRRDRLMLHRAAHLDDGCRACRPPGLADVGFDAPKRNDAMLLFEHLVEGCEFDSVADSRRRRMCFHVLHGLDAYPRRAVGSLDGKDLPFLLRLSHRRPFAIAACPA